MKSRLVFPLTSVTVDSFASHTEQDVYKDFKALAGD